MFGSSKKEEEKKEPAADPNNPAGGAAEAAAPEVGKMKRGDYMIHVFIEQAKNLRLEGEDTCDPMIEVTCLDIKKYTSAKDDIGPTGVVQWSEHLFFEPKRLEVEDVEAGKISIRVMNKGFFKEDTIGIYEFDVAHIYFMKEHTLFHQWLALSNPEGKDFNEITCYVKVSISVTGPGDDSVQLTEASAGVEGTDTAVVLMPSSIKKQYKQLYFRIFKAENLPKMDMLGSIDAYLMTTFFKQSLKTEVVTMKDKLVTWDQEMLLPIQWPVASNRLVFKLFDYEKAGSDEIVGSLIFSIKDIVTVNERTYKWVNLYGAPLDYSGDNATKMNNNPEYASSWKGRLLLQYYAEDTKHPEMKIQPISNAIKQEAAKWVSQNQYEIMCEIGSAICIPDTKKYKIKIMFNDFSIITDAPLEYKETYCRWTKRFDVQTLTCVYPTVEELGRIYVYLMDGDVPVCYWKGLAKDFQDPNPEYKWLPFTADLAIGKVTENHKAGMFQMKLSINNKTKNGSVDFKNLSSWKKPPPKRLQSWKIRCYIYQCKDLPAADSEGSSDPYVEVWSTAKDKVLSPVVEDNCNPIFLTTREIFMDFVSPQEAPPIVLNIWDKDEGVFESDDFIGRAVVFLKDAAYSEDDSLPAEPRWHKVTMGFHEGEPSIGEILCSFSVVPDDYNFKVPSQYMNLADYMNFKEFNVEINVLGLRMLQSVGLMPVKKAFVKFNIRSLLPPEKAKAVQNVSTNPQDTGANPNINTTVQFIINLPQSSLFCPKLSCDVYDMIFKGFVQPILGTFSIPIGEILEETQRNSQEELNEAAFIIEQLKKILAQGGAAASLRNIEEEEKGGAQRNSVEPRVSVKQVEVSVEEREQIEKMGASALKQKPTQKGFGKQAGKVEEQMENGMRGKFFKVKMENEVQQKAELAMQRDKDMEDMKKAGQKTHKNIQMPSYAFDERLKINREVNLPPPSLFMGLGYNKTPEEQKRHYRRYYPDELENVKEVMPKMPFHECIVRRGQSRGASKGGLFSMFSKQDTDDTGEVTTIKEVGKFKGIINVYNSNDAEVTKAEKKKGIDMIKNLIRDVHQKKTQEVMAFDFDKLESQEARGKFNQLMEKLGLAELQLSNFLLESAYEGMLAKMMVSKTKAIVRVYFVEGFDFSQRDVGSFSDPYLKVTCGKKEYNDRDNYQLDNPNPKFFKHFDFDVEFPGAPPLVVRAYDYDDLFGDDIIGETVVDLDDRFFSSEWQSIKEKPIEYRALHHPSSTVAQGVIKMWVEINQTTKSTAEEKVWDIIPRPQKDYEVRLVVWDTKDIVCMDAEGTSDIYIRCFFDTKDAKETDCHYRCQNGKGSFNYRLLYRVNAPQDHYTLTMQAWDRDFFKSNDLIGDTSIDLKPLFEDVIETQRTIALNKKYYSQYLQGVMPDVPIKFEDEDSFWLPCKGLDPKTKAVRDNGFVRISVTVLPIELADGSKVGDARTEPNHSPFLPQPTGRLTFSMNPFTMFNQLVGPEIRRKIYCACCCIIVLALIVAMLPMIMSNLISQAIIKSF